MNVNHACHSEQREESQGSSHKRCFVPQHDNNSACHSEPIYCHSEPKRGISLWHKLLRCLVPQHDKRKTGILNGVKNLVLHHNKLSYRSLYLAFKQAKRSKKPSHNRLNFESHWLTALLRLEQQLKHHQWQPSPSVCFVAKRPKAREIHAPDFADRVVHHWLVPQLEGIYEPVFIYDSFANRKDKGTHAAVSRLQDFVRQVHSGQGGGYYLQLDIHNFFNSIHRATLYGLLKGKINCAPSDNLTLTPALSLGERGQNALPFSIAHKNNLLHVVHALLRHHPQRANSTIRATQQELNLVPAHKRLGNAAKGCGLPIGNLSSQFFANVYLNELDQFVKHTLKVKRYVRYVDDFVLVHHSKAQLQKWLIQLQDFLHTTLQLRLKDDIKLQQLTAGIDFLGYWLYPTHRLVRPRVIHHAQEKLDAWQSRYVRRTAEGWRINAPPAEQALIRSVWASYQGHFNHANSYKLQQQFYNRYGWLSIINPLPRGEGGNAFSPLSLNETTARMQELEQRMERLPRVREKVF